MIKYINEYIKYYKNNRANNTNKSYTSKIKDFFSNYSTINELNINLYINTKKTSGSKISAKAALLNYYNFLVLFDYVEDSLKTKKIQSIKKETKIPEFLTEKEVQKFMNYVEKKAVKWEHIIIFKLFSNLGLRISELTNIQIKDINFEESTLLVKKSDKIFKTKKERVNFLNSKLKEEIQLYVSKNDLREDDYLIQTKENSIREWTKKYALRCGIKKDIHPHTLRHTTASLMSKKGLNPYEISENLGHSLETTMLYVHTESTKRKKNAELIRF